MWSNPQFPADLVTFTKEILNEKLFSCSEDSNNSINVSAKLMHFILTSSIPCLTINSNSN